MKVRILRPTVAEGVDAFEGEELVLADDVAKDLIRMGKAVEAAAGGKAGGKAAPTDKKE